VFEEEVARYMESMVTDRHTFKLLKHNTLLMQEFPKADVIFVDAGHTKECIENDVKLAANAINNGGTIIFHDYGQKSWPDVKPAIDKYFGNKVRSFHTLAIIQ
jgi:16S rRNA G966 N2-methylase RsmD